MFNKTKYNFWLDATIFIAFLITAITGLLLWLVIPHEQGSQALSLLGLSRRTWVGLHDWAGLAMLIGATASYRPALEVGHVRGQALLREAGAAGAPQLLAQQLLVRSFRIGQPIGAGGLVGSALRRLPGWAQPAV